MEILNNNDLMSEILNLLSAESLSNLYFAFHYLNQRWIRQLRVKYSNQTRLLFKRFASARNEICYLCNDIYTRSWMDRHIEANLIWKILLKLERPDYLTIDYELINQSDVTYTLSRLINDDLDKIEQRIYDLIINLQTMSLDVPRIN